MLSVLFPEYSYIHVQKNGIVKLGSKLWVTHFTKHKLGVSELCWSELLKRLIKYRKGNETSYKKLLLEHQIYTDFYDYNNNLVDFLYNEFSKIKSSSKVDILLEDAHQSLLNSIESDKIITIKTIFAKPRKRYNCDTVVEMLQKKYSIKDHKSIIK